MNPIIIPMMALSIPIIALVSTLIVKPLLEQRSRRLEIEANATAEKAAQYAAQVERLEQRVRVLERIITDRGIGVADEIERLRDAPLN
ncbi:hypothetical protein [Sphingomonas baiyangensis]|uniref:Phage shock protein B n=1 Tax=Sphingomonas baiyangensis TaxID=2572576 RepID=A0A4U1L207_9SPHN|nr:hypothetical protein [Sphingomonas baiyangensis]TKD50891.1 hypothetical protein FBR43_09035 [Sphingomonas baiyangensis]